MPRLSNSRGDTVIEVLIAITVFSFIAIGGISLMNKGTAMAQKALEIGLVRQQMDAQADVLRYINRAYSTDYGKNGAATDLWRDVVVENAVDEAQNYSEIINDGECRIPSVAENAFALDVRRFLSDPPLVPTNNVATYAKVRYDSGGATAEGIWVQAVRSPTVINDDDGEVRPGFYDFHIRACWHSPGQDIPVTLGTIVRLYEPRG